jgi:hypothetical protein
MQPEGEVAHPPAGDKEGDVIHRLCRMRQLFENPDGFIAVTVEEYRGGHRGDDGQIVCVDRYGAPGDCAIVPPVSFLGDRNRHEAEHQREGARIRQNADGVGQRLEQRQEPEEGAEDVLAFGNPGDRLAQSVDLLLSGRSPRHERRYLTHYL